MSRPGRPLGTTRKGNITRSISLPAELYKKSIWIADLWTKEALADSFDGSQAPEYWNMPRVIASVLAEYFESLEAQYPELKGYFEKCKARDASLKSISRSPSQLQPTGV